MKSGEVEFVGAISNCVPIYRDKNGVAERELRV